MGDEATPAAVWGGFARDPRDPAVAGLRMSDRDRAHLMGTLGEAYADGRLDPQEHDERVGTAQAAKTFGEVPALLDDLVPSVEVVRWSAPTDLRQRAEEMWRRDLRTSLTGFAGVSVVTIAIWLVTSLAAGFSFPWFVFPVFFTGLNAAQHWLKHDEIVTRRTRKLQRAQDREQRRLGRGGS